MSDQSVSTVRSASHAGTLTIQSKFDCRETMDRLQAGTLARGIKVFAHIDFRRDAEANGLELEDCSLLVIGNPKLGTKLLQENPHLGIELPLKVLVFTMPSGVTLLEFNDLIVLADRFGIDQPNLEVLSKMQHVMAGLVREAAGQDLAQP